MNKKSYIIFLCFVLCGAHALVSALNGDSTAVAPAPEQAKLTKLEKAADDTIDESVQRDFDLLTKLSALEAKLDAITRNQNLDPKKSIKDSLTPSQLDEFNMIVAQMRYLQLSRYAEAIKRRKVLALTSLIEAEEKDDELFADKISSGSGFSDLTEVNAAISNKLRELGLSDWEAVMNQLDTLQNNRDAQSIPLKAVVTLLENAKKGDFPVPDSGAFLMADDLKDTTAYKILVERLDIEIKKGDTGAAEVKKHLTAFATQ